MSETISLDLAKKFKEAGIEFETKYVYHIHAPIDCECPSILMIKPEYNYSAFLIAPTSEEIWARLPESINKGDLCQERKTPTSLVSEM